MQILLFDMDGVLIEPNGYHRALQETVRLASRTLGFEPYELSPAMIARFESLGISNEWHSSAMFTALMLLEGQRQGLTRATHDRPLFPDSTPRPLTLDLDPLFILIESEPLGRPPLERALKAVESLARRAALDPVPALDLLRGCESVDHSLTLNLFQELILGSEAYTRIYAKPSRLSVDSYLERYDRSLLAPALRDELLRWLEAPDRGASIMTNRPSAALLGSAGTPEAEMAAGVVDLRALPLVGSGEMVWLARRLDRARGELLKPAPHHALAAILAAAENPIAEALLEAHRLVSGKSTTSLPGLQGCRVHVFEDTPGGMLSLDRAQQVLDAHGVSIRVEKHGLAHDPAKRRALEAAGAQVSPILEEALAPILRT